MVYKNHVKKNLEHQNIEKAKFGTENTPKALDQHSQGRKQHCE